MSPPEGPAAGSARYPWRAAPAARVAAATRPAVAGARAGLVTRVLASTVDLLVVVLLVVAGYLAVAATRFLLHPVGFTFPTASTRSLLLIVLGVLAAYLTITWIVLGATVGDRLMGLRVVGVRGSRLHWAWCVVRAAFCTVFPIGLFWVLVSRENRSVQDIVLRTSVVHDP
jgi:uncharacterized RDD family membrane protein YckC